MDALFLDQLKRVCAAHPTRAKWVVVPTHTIGRTLGDRLAREGCDWANLRFVTPLDLALRMGAPFLVERGIDPSEEGLGPALVMRLLLTLPEEGGYFRPLATQPDLAMALWATIRELRMTGVKAADLDVDAFTSPEKHAELAALLASYETYLTTTNRGDRATVFEEARRHPDWCPVRDEDCLVELPGVRWQTLEQALLTSLPGERKAIEDDLADVSALLSHDAQPRPSAALEFFTAGGVEAEVEEVFRRVLVSGVPLDTVEIACASDRYPALIWEKALRYEWPVTLASGIPATLTRPGRLLLSWVQWIEDDFAAGRLRGLLQSGDLKLADDVGLSSARAARLVITAQAAWGRETYRLALHRHAASERRRALRDDLEPDYRDRLLKSAEEAENLAAWLTAFIGAVPMPDAEGLVDVVALADAARGCVATAAARTSALDHLAASRLDETLRELRSLGRFRCPMHQALRFIRERVEGLSVGSDRARPGHLFVSSLRDAGLPGRAHVFVVGLEEGRVVPAAIEDPIVLDAERVRIHGALRISSAKVDEAVHTILRRLMALARSPGVRLCCSYSCRDLRQFSETYASWLMLHLYRQASGDPEKSYGDLRDHVGTPVSCVPATDAAVLGPGRWWLRRVTAAGEAAGRKAVVEQFPALAAGIAAAEARESDTFTAYDGYVPEAGPELDPCAPAVVSPTQLEKAAGCPFRYFLERGLKVTAIESGERDQDVWLNPLIRGSLLHDLYASLLRRTRAGDRSPSVKADAVWFRAQAEQTLDQLATEMPPPSLEVRERESRDFLDDVDLFVEHEETVGRTRTAVGLEVAFGRRSPDDPEVLSTSEPVTVKAGPLTFQVVGRVDRIDRLADGSFSIVDYKTGGFWRDSWQGAFAGGRRLQHALYGLAAQTMLKQITKAPKISAAQYYFPSRKGGQRVKTIDAQTPAVVGKVLGDLRDVLTRGLFLHTPSAGDCKFCHFQAACGANAHARAKAKLGDPVLAPNQRLASHE